MGSVDAFLQESFPWNPTFEEAKDFLDRSETLLVAAADLSVSQELKLRLGRVYAQLRLNSEHARTEQIALTKLAADVSSPVSDAYQQLGWALIHSGIEHSQRRREIARHALSVARSSNDPHLLTSGYFLLTVTYLELGEIRELDALLTSQELAQIPEFFGPGVDPQSWLSVLRLIFDGDVIGARQGLAAMSQRTAGQPGEHGVVELSFQGMLLWMSGDMHAAEELFLKARRMLPDQLLWPASLAWLWLLQGRQQAGLQMLRSIPPLAKIPHNRNWLPTMLVLGEIAIHHGERGRAQEIFDTLLPYAESLVPIGIGVSFWGTCARTLGLLAERLGDLGQARELLESAVEISGRAGILAWHAEAQIDLAQFLQRHRTDLDLTYSLLNEAYLTSVAHGFAMLAMRAEPQPLIRVLGTFEVYSLGGELAKWNSRKARDLLKMLVAARGVARSREVFMHELWPDQPPSRLANRFAVALNVIRRALDPERVHPTNYYLHTEGDAVRLIPERISIDLEEFMRLGKSADTAEQSAAISLYRGEAFSDDPYCDWALAVRLQAAAIYENLLN